MNRWFAVATLGLMAAALAATVAPAATSSARWNVTEAGAVGDGVADSTAIFQRVLDAAGDAGGGVVDVPAGRYRIDGRLRVPANVTLQGIFRVPPTSGPRAVTNMTGSVLFAYAGRGTTNGEPFIRLAGNNAAVSGLAIAYPEWSMAQVPPVPYPPCIGSQDTENVGVSECLLLNPYEGIRLVRAHRHLVRNVTGYPIRRGIFVDECYDIGHIENVHFWPFGVSYDAQNPYCQWINLNGVAFELARTDWHYIHNTFCFGYGIGYLFSQSKQGSANGNFLGLGADSCERAVVVEQAQPPGLLFTNGEFVGRWSSTNAVCLEVRPEAEGKVSLVNCSFWGPIDRCIWMRSATGQLTVSACNFVHWDAQGTGAPALQLDAGRAIVQGCTFGQDNLHVLVSSNAGSVILTANQAPGGFRFENHAGARLQSGLNEPDPIAWTPEARARYRLEIGSAGDGRYLTGFHGPEKSERPFRWSMARSRLLLPAVPGERAKLTFEVRVPDAARDAEGGLFLDGERLAPLPDDGPWVVDLPPATGERRLLELRCRGWNPSRVVQGSTDQRLLGVQLFRLTVESPGARQPVFNANSGTTRSADTRD